MGVGAYASRMQFQRAAQRLGHHGLADGFEHQIGLHHKALATALQLAVSQSRTLKLHAAGLAVVAQHLHRAGPVLDVDAVF